MHEITHACKHTHTRTHTHTYTHKHTHTLTHTHTHTHIYTHIHTHTHLHTPYSLPHENTRDTKTHKPQPSLELSHNSWTMMMTRKRTVNGLKLMTGRGVEFKVETA